MYHDEAGNVVRNHMEVKAILDILRTTCKHHTEPIADLCRAYNRETKDGYKMDKYSRLLDKSIESIIDVKEADDLNTLFNTGSDILFNSGIKGLDDFELITFVVIK